MAASLLGGAAVGAVFGELLKAVLEIKDKVTIFKQTLTSLKSILETIAPVIKEIEQQNNELGRPKEELEPLIREMEEGTKLVRRCSEINMLNYWTKGRQHQKQLEALRDSLVKFFIINMQAYSSRDQKETLLKVRKVYSWINNFPLVKAEDTAGSSSDSIPVSEAKICDSTTRQAADENADETNYKEEAVTIPAIGGVPQGEVAAELEERGDSVIDPENTGMRRSKKGRLKNSRVRMYHVG